MQARRILTTAALVAGVFILAAPAAYAQSTYDWNGSQNVNWSNANNWTRTSGSGSAPPGSGDTANIPSGDIDNEPTVDSTVSVGTITISSGRTLTISNPLTVGTFTINSGSTVSGTSSLTINTTLTMGDDLTIGTFTMGSSASGTTGANTLTVNDSSGFTISSGGLLNVDDAGLVDLAGGGTHTINGTAANNGLRLSIANSRLRISSSATLSGTGYIEGQHDSALIELAADVAFTSAITIEGNLQIVPVQYATGTRFINNGFVDANNAGTLELNVHYLDTATPTGPSGSWRVGDSGSAFLKFSVGSTLMSGTFTVSNGMLDIDQNITTSGNLTFTGGTISVAPGVTFQAS
jgi:hypothetical protein